MGDKVESITVQERPPWIDDSSVKSCRKCNKEFGVFTRKVLCLSFSLPLYCMSSHSLFTASLQVCQDDK